MPNRHTRRAVAVVIALATGLIYAAARPGSSDFSWPLRAARDLLAGRDPYGYTFGALSIPYPLPAALVGMPLCWLPDRLAAAVFVGASAGLLAYAVTRESWRGLLVFLSAPYYYALVWAQWSPLIAAAASWPALAGALALVKPQIALPVLLPRLKPSAMLAGLTVLLLSLLALPGWPAAWISQIGAYQRYVPLLTPAGPLVALALLGHRPSWRDPRSQTLLLALLMPQRAAYDTVILWTTLRPGPGAVLATLCSWGVTMVPGGEGAAVALAIYLPIILASAPRSIPLHRALRKCWRFFRIAA